MANGKLTAKSKMVLDYVRENSGEDGISLQDLADGVGMTTRQIGPIVWTVLQKEKEGVRPALVTYEKREIEGEEKPVGYVMITEAGRAYEEEEEELAE